VFPPELCLRSCVSRGGLQSLGRPWLSAMFSLSHYYRRNHFTLLLGNPVGVLVALGSESHIHSGACLEASCPWNIAVLRDPPSNGPLNAVESSSEGFQ